MALIVQKYGGTSVGSAERISMSRGASHAGNAQAIKSWWWCRR